MNTADAAKLCRFVSCLCSGQRFDPFSAEAWALTLGHIDYEDAKQAAAELASQDLEPGKARYIEPGHIIAQVRRIRTKRIDEYGPIDPPSGISNADYLEWLKATRNAIASGHAPARPIRAIDEGARKRADELIAGVTDALPDIESA